MTSPAKRHVEVFTAGCPACDDTVALVNQLACPSCEVEVLDMHQPEGAARASGYGIRRVPSVVVDGQLADCCSGQGSKKSALQAAGLGQS